MNKNYNGITSEEAKKLQIKYGKNELVVEKQDNFFKKIISVLLEPMFLLLFGASIIYLILGEINDGIIMLFFVSVIIAIDIIKELKTDKTLKKLKKLSSPNITVIRDKKEQQILSIDLLPGDLMLVHEGNKIPADGIIIQSADF